MMSSPSPCPTSTWWIWRRPLPVTAAAGEANAMARAAREQATNRRSGRKGAVERSGWYRERLGTGLDSSRMPASGGPLLDHDHLADAGEAGRLEAREVGARRQAPTGIVAAVPRDG